MFFRQTECALFVALQFYGYPQLETERMLQETHYFRRFLRRSEYD